MPPHRLEEVSSKVYPGLERKKGGNDNWVEAAGGLPSYIERIAKHLHYEKGKSISTAIAMAVNTVKRWATGTNHNGSKLKPETVAKAQKALAEWEAKKGKSKAKDIAEATQEAAEATDAELDELFGAACNKLLMIEGLLMTLGDKAAGKTAKRNATATAVQLLEAKKKIDWRDQNEDFMETKARLSAERHVTAWLVDALQPDILQENTVMQNRPPPGVRSGANEPKYGGRGGPAPGGYHQAGSKTRSKTRGGGKVKDPEFEKKHPRAPKGRVGGGQWIQAGSSGAAVKGLQRELGMSGKQLDGEFGPQTEAAVRAFQEEHGLIVDGIVGAQTAGLMMDEEGVEPGELSAEARAFLAGRATDKAYTKTRRKAGTLAEAASGGDHDTSGKGEKHHKIKCPKCDSVQSAKNGKCKDCGHELSKAKKAKFAKLDEAVAAAVDECREELIACTDAVKQRLLKDELAELKETAELVEATGGALRMLPGGRWQLRDRRGQWVDMNRADLPKTGATPEQIAELEHEAKLLEKLMLDQPTPEVELPSAGKKKRKRWFREAAELLESPDFIERFHPRSRIGRFIEVPDFLEVDFKPPSQMRSPALKSPTTSRPKGTVSAAERQLARGYGVGYGTRFEQRGANRGKPKEPRTPKSMARAMGIDNSQQTLGSKPGSMLSPNVAKMTPARLAQIQASPHSEPKMRKAAAAEIRRRQGNRMTAASHGVANMNSPATMSDADRKLARGYGVGYGTRFEQRPNLKEPKTPKSTAQAMGIDTTAQTLSTKPGSMLSPSPATVSDEERKLARGYGVGYGTRFEQRGAGPKINTDEPKTSKSMASAMGIDASAQTLGSKPGSMLSPDYSREQIDYGKKMAEQDAMRQANLLDLPVVSATASDKDGIEWLKANPDKRPGWSNLAQNLTSPQNKRRKEMAASATDMRIDGRDLVVSGPRGREARFGPDGRPKPGSMQSPPFATSTGLSAGDKVETDTGVTGTVKEVRRTGPVLPGGGKNTVIVELEGGVTVPWEENRLRNINPTPPDNPWGHGPSMLGALTPASMASPAWLDERREVRTGGDNEDNPQTERLGQLSTERLQQLIASPTVDPKLKAAARRVLQARQSGKQRGGNPLGALRRPSTAQ